MLVKYEKPHRITCVDRATGRTWTRAYATTGRRDAAVVEALGDGYVCIPWDVLRLPFERAA